MAKIKQNIDFKELVNITDRQLGKEIGINNNELGAKINDKGDLATRIAGGYTNGQITKNLGSVLKADKELEEIEQGDL